MNVQRFDLRAQRVPSRPKVRMVGVRPAVRDPRDVDSVVIHQTAVEYGLDKHGVMLREAGGDRALAMARRALRVACHGMAFRDGLSVLSTPGRWYVNHGNGFNSRSLGLEIDGRYSGRRDDPRTAPRREDLETTHGGPPSVITPTIIAAGRDALRWLVESGREEGMPIKLLWAHRQSSKTRRADPGEELWCEVAEWGAAELGLRIAYAATVGGGRPIPLVWSPRGVGSY